MAARIPARVPTVLKDLDSSAPVPMREHLDPAVIGFEEAGVVSVDGVGRCTPKLDPGQLVAVIALAPEEAVVRSSADNHAAGWIWRREDLVLPVVHPEVVQDHRAQHDRDRDKDGHKTNKSRHRQSPAHPYHKLMMPGLAPTSLTLLRRCLLTGVTRDLPTLLLPSTLAPEGGLVPPDRPRTPRVGRRGIPRWGPAPLAPLAVAGSDGVDLRAEEEVDLAAVGRPEDENDGALVLVSREPGYTHRISQGGHGRQPTGLQVGPGLGDLVVGQATGGGLDGGDVTVLAGIGGAVLAPVLDLAAQQEGKEPHGEDDADTFGVQEPRHALPLTRAQGRVPRPRTNLRPNSAAPGGVYGEGPPSPYCSQPSLGSHRLADAAAGDEGGASGEEVVGAPGGQEAPDDCLHSLAGGGMALRAQTSGESHALYNAPPLLE